jgi:acetyltransferase-like isoleucine patch superfamily enzyme
MIPGISTNAEARLTGILDPRVTAVAEDTYAARDYAIMDAGDEEARRLGVTALGGGVTLVVTDPSRKLGDIRIQSNGRDNTLFFDNLTWGGNCHASIRMLGSDTVMLFNDIGDEYVAMPDIYLRSNGQFVFWGRGASAVGLSMEIEGEGIGVIIGDDALISNGVWIRNHDMHAIHDLRTGTRINRPPVQTVIERHVWLGQDAMLLGTERIGMGAIVGTRSLVKGTVPPRVVVAGTPARVIREGVSWGRSNNGMTAAERLSIGLPEAPEA